MNSIRNFAIIAHVDHGKSTLADRLLELTGVVDPNKHEEQLLDKNPISRERGITIKLAPVRMEYTLKVTNDPTSLKLGGAGKLKIGETNSEALNSTFYTLNLIDTPGHVDFSYEVERTLACVEGVLLLVDATQGIQAQTIAHAYKAIEQNLEIIPVVNKIDSPLAEVDKNVKALAEFLGTTEESVFKISAKSGLGVPELLDALVTKIPSPDQNYKLSHDNQEVGPSDVRALIFDSYYDAYRGVIAFVRVFNGSLKKGQKVYMHASETSFEIDEVGFFTPDLHKDDSIEEGQIGYVVTKLKDIHTVQVGDSMTSSSTIAPLQGYKKVKPMMYTSFFPTDPDDYHALSEALEKLALNDSALTWQPLFSNALGAGYRVGFLGLLHADVVRQRLENEYDVHIISTPPTVEYKEYPKGGKTMYEEPMVTVNIVIPDRFIGDVMNIANDCRAEFKHMDNKSDIVYMSYEMPLAELISGFFDNLKTVTSGYGSLDWEFKGYNPVEVSKLVIMLNLTPVDELSIYTVADRAYITGRDLTNKLKELIPRQQYEVKIQASYGGKIIASTRVAPLRKDVTAKLYGGDRTRKDKLLKKQKEGKKKMKMIGKIQLPKDVFLKLFSKSS